MFIHIQKLAVLYVLYFFCIMQCFSNCGLWQFTRWSIRQSHRKVQWNSLYCHDLGVTIDGVQTGEWIYWPLIHMTQNYKHLKCYRWSIHFSNHYMLSLLELIVSLLGRPNRLPCNPFACTEYKKLFPKVTLSLLAYLLPWEFVYWSVP
jgi:hypothetical protein